MLKKENNYIINQNQKTKNFVEEKIINIFSLSGIPPSISFIIKITILSIIIRQIKINLIIIIIINLILLFSFAYIKTVLNILTQKNIKKKKIKNKK